MKFTATLLIALLTGCATVPREGGIADVQREVAARTNQNIEVRSRASNTDDDRVRGMLGGELDADKAVAIALLNNPRVQVALADLGLARADLIEASTIHNPILGAEIRFPGSPARPYEVTLTQSILDLVFLPRRRSAGLAAFEAAKFRAASAVLTIAADVRAGYYDLLAATQHISMDRVTLESAKAAAELALRQHEAGNITDLDLENQQAMYEQAKVDLSRSEEQALLLREALIRDMALRDSSMEWKIASSFPALPAAEPTDAELQALLAARRLDIAATQRDVDAARRRLPAARAEAIGDVSAGVHRERDADGTVTTGPEIQIPIPIFNRGLAARSRLEAQRLRAEQELALLTASAASEARAARQAVVAARGRVEYYRDVILPRRKRIVDLTQVEHNAMLAGTFQLLQARQNEAEARRESIDAQREYWISRVNLDRALSGISDEQREHSAQRRGGH